MTGAHHEAYALAHIRDGGIMQRATFGHVSIICHGHKKHHLTTSQGVQEEYLGHAAFRGDGPVLHEEVNNHFGGSQGGQTHISEREVTE